MHTARIALRDLADPDVGLQWFEAVALTLAVAEAWPADARLVAPFDAFTLSADGSVRPLPGLPASAAPASQLGFALQALLVDAEAPQALRDAALVAAQSPPAAPLAPHLRAIAYFERPDRARQLLFLAQRAVTAVPAVDADEELRRLERRARQRAEGERPPGRAARIVAALSRAWRLAAPVTPVLVIATALVVAGWAAYRRPGVRAAITRPLQQAAAWLRPAPPPPADAATGQEPHDTPPARASRTNPHTAPAAPAGAPAAVPAPPAEAPPAAAPAGGSPAAPDLAEGSLPEIRDMHLREVARPGDGRGAPADEGIVIEGIGRVFRAGDAGVEPARVGRRYLPTTVPEGVPPGRTGVFELLVDEKGRVERVRLLSADNRYQERMLLAAAKAWRFEPARRLGVPVKFLTQVTVTW